MTAEDYRVTTPWGYSASYPLNGGRHRGEDRAMPVNTPIRVNGVQIGLSGDTGYVTGPHLHIGKWIGGVDFDPAGGGLNVVGPARITQVASDSINGNFVALNDANGVRWVYLHMTKQTASVGQEIPATATISNGGEEMINDYDNEFIRVNDVFIRIRGRGVSREDFRQYIVGNSWLRMLEIATDSPEAIEAQHAQEVGQLALRDKWDQQIYTLLDQKNAIQAALEAQTKVITDIQAADSVTKADLNKALAHVASLNTDLQAKQKELDALAADPKIVYTHDQATSDNVSTILKVVNSIKGLVLNLFKKK